MRGQILERWNMKRKYHSGLMPAGAEPKGSAFWPSCQGNSGQPGQDRQGEIPAHHVVEQKIGHEGHARDLLLPAILLDGRFRHADPVLLHQEEVQPNQPQGGQRQDHYVQGIEAGQHVAGDVLAAAGHRAEIIADDGNHAGDGRAHTRGKKRQLVPRQQVAAEAKGEEDEKQQNAGYPGDFAAADTPA